MPQIYLVGVKGFEPPAPCSQSTCATRLRYTPPNKRPAQATLIIICKTPWVVNSKIQNFFDFFEKSLKPLIYKGLRLYSPVRISRM